MIDLHTRFQPYAKNIVPKESYVRYPTHSRLTVDDQEWLKKLRQDEQLQGKLHQGIFNRPQRYFSGHPEWIEGVTANQSKALGAETDLVKRMLMLQNMKRENENIDLSNPLKNTSHEARLNRLKTLENLSKGVKQIIDASPRGSPGSGAGGADLINLNSDNITAPGRNQMLNIMGNLIQSEVMDVKATSSAFNDFVTQDNLSEFLEQRLGVSYKSTKFPPIFNFLYYLITPATVGGANLKMRKEINNVGFSLGYKNKNQDGSVSYRYIASNILDFVMDIVDDSVADMKFEPALTAGVRNADYDSYTRWKNNISSTQTNVYELNVNPFLKYLTIVYNNVYNVGKELSPKYKTILSESTEQEMLATIDPASYVLDSIVRMMPNINGANLQTDAKDIKQSESLKYVNLIDITFALYDETSELSSKFLPLYFANGNLKDNIIARINQRYAENTLYKKDVIMRSFDNLETPESREIIVDYMCFYYLENWECIPLFEETNDHITSMLFDNNNLLSRVIHKFKDHFLRKDSHLIINIFVRYAVFLLNITQIAILINLEETRNTTDVVIKSDISTGEISNKLEQMKAYLQTLTTSISENIKSGYQINVTISILKSISDILYSISKNDSINEEDFDSEYDASFRFRGGPRKDSARASFTTSTPKRSIKEEIASGLDPTRVLNGSRPNDNHLQEETRAVRPDLVETKFNIKQSNAGDGTDEYAWAEQPSISQQFFRAPVATFPETGYGEITDSTTQNSDRFVQGTTGNYKDPIATRTRLAYARRRSTDQEYDRGISDNVGSAFGPASYDDYSTHWLDEGRTMSRGFDDIDGGDVSNTYDFDQEFFSPTESYDDGVEP